MRLPARYGTPALAGALGAAGALGQAPWGLWPLTLLALAAFGVMLCRARGWRGTAFLGWAFGTGYFALSLSWIVEPFLVDVARHGWMAPFALVFLSAGLALLWGAGVAPAGRLRPALRPLAAVAGLGVAEWLRGWLFTGFPWAAPAQVWVGQGADQLLAWTGPLGLTLLTMAAGLLPAAALARRAWPRAALLALPALALAGGGAIVAATAEPPALRDVTVRLVQPNAEQRLKWDPQMIPVFFGRQVEYSAAEPRPDLIVWPETSISALLENAEPMLERIGAAAPGVPVVVGAQRIERARIYNSLVLLRDGRPAALYDKHHLVPFGEYVPFGDVASRLGISGFAAREGVGFSAGPGPRLIDFGAAGLGLPLICYEAVFPRNLRSAERPDFLIQITNDGWFGRFSGPFQHLAQARMRAIEQGLPAIRVANTGVSAMIGPRGQVLESIPLGEAGYADAALPVPLPPTLYARTGDWPALAALVLLLGGLATAARRRPR